MTLGEAALRIAEGEVGNGEERRNNHGFHINKYRRGVKPIASGAWCAMFIWWCIEEAWCGLGNKQSRFPWSRTPSANKTVARLLQKQGRAVEFEHMQPGDIVLFDRRGGKHVSIVKRVFRNEESGLIDSYFTIDGNKGYTPALVKHIRRERYPRPEKIVRL